jgi:hypothetical protein
VDDLILLSEYININRISLEDLILAYQKKKRQLLKITNGMAFEELKSNVLQSYLNFHNYIRDTLDAIPSHRRLIPSEIQEILDAYQLFESDSNA